MSGLSPRALLGGAFRLRRFQPGDAPSWFALLTDPRVFGPTSWNISNLGEVEAMVERHTAAGLRWAVARSADDALVGTCGATRWETSTGVAEVAYELSPDVRGRGLATAAVDAFLDEAAGAGLRHVEAHTWTGNDASAAVLTRCGFARVERRPAFRDCRGEWRDFWRWSRALPAP